MEILSPNLTGSPIFYPEQITTCRGKPLLGNDTVPECTQTSNSDFPRYRWAGRVRVFPEGYRLAATPLSDDVVHQIHTAVERNERLRFSCQRAHLFTCTVVGWVATFNTNL